MGIGFVQVQLISACAYGLYTVCSNFTVDVVAEMVLPTNANVYYAVNTAFNLNFILRLKTNEDDSPAQPPKPNRTKGGKKFAQSAS